MKEIGKNRISGDSIYLWEIDSINSLELPPFPTDCFGILFLNNEDMDLGKFDSFATRLLKSGLVYIDFFGINCQKVCLEMDHVVTATFPNETYADVIMTTARENVSFAECLWNFLYVSFRADQFQSKTNAQIILTLSNCQEKNEIINLVEDQPFLYKKVKGYVPKEFN